MSRRAFPSTRHRLLIAAVAMLGVGSMLTAGMTPAAPPRHRTTVRSVTSPRPRQTTPPPVTPLDVHPAQFRDAGSELPGWLVQLTIDPMPTPAAAVASSAAVDAVVRDTIGAARVTQRYEYAVVGFAAFMSPVEAARLLADPRVRRVEPDLVMHGGGMGDDLDGYVGDPDADGPWGLRRISDPDGLAPSFDPCGADGSGVTAVVIDSGIIADHTEFEDRVVAAVNFNPTVPDATDQNGHGTHVAGTIAGRTVGVAPGADIVALRVFGPSNSGPTSAIVAALNWLASPFNLDGPAVVNMSLGGPVIGNAFDIYFEALSVVQGRGMPIVAAASNFSYPARWSMPATAADTICVGATGIHDRPAVFSSNGPSVDIWAPGVNILSADWQHPDGGLTIESGTSMASPMTAGVVALHLQRFPPDPSTQAPGGARFDAVRRTLALIANGAKGRLTDWSNADVVAPGANGALAGAANVLLQACTTDDSGDCGDVFGWDGDATSIVLGNGIDPLPPGFTCSRVIAHPTSVVELTVNAPAILPVIDPDGQISSVAGDMLITDLGTGQPVWIASSTWHAQSGHDRTLYRRLVASSFAGFRVDWLSYRDDLPGGYGYALTATASMLEFMPADLDQDGGVGAADLGELLAAWGPCTPGATCLSDLNRDGVTNSADLGILLAVWGEVPVPGRPGFILDCAGNLVPGTWLGDERLDDGTRSFIPDPLIPSAAAIAADLDCERLDWDAPRVGTGISNTDPRPGAIVRFTEPCSEGPRADAATGFFYGHGTTCEEPQPFRSLDDWCDGGALIGDPARRADGADFGYTLVRQPLPTPLRSIDRVDVLGGFGLRAPSNSNVQPQQQQRLSPWFTGDLRITLAFDDATTGTVVRSPETGLIADLTTGDAFLGCTAHAVHADDGRVIESICLTAAPDAPGLAMDRVFNMLTTTLEADDPAPGAEYSPDNGHTWYPLLAADGRRLQVLMCITGE